VGSGTSDDGLLLVLPGPVRELGSACCGAWRIGVRRCGASIDLAVVASLDAGMVLVAWDQKDGVVVAIGVRTLDGDLSTVVDLNRLRQINAGIGW
jgi:hypothetical protein